MVVGEHQSVGRHHNARAIAGEIHNGILQGVVAIIQFVISELEAFSLHGLIHLWRQVVDSPHALVGVDSSRRHHGGQQ